MMRLKSIGYLGFNACLLCLLLVGCANQEEPQSQTVETDQDKAHNLMMAVLWQQTAGETKALQYQAYQLAEEKMKAALQLKKNKKWAVILDLDETVLDNSPYQAYTVQSGESYPVGWDDWVQSASAKLIPGAKKFLDEANQSGIKIFYVSNRDNKHLSATIRNMNDLKLPQVDENHILLKTETSNKASRRAKIKQDHEIMMSVGDNLGDFAEDYYKKPLQERNQIVDEQKEQFGSLYITLPNPMYGDWEGAIYEYKYDLTEEEKADLREKALKSFR
ncbi:5'-nucleotidase, lipoprotein e(P4) family [Hazenella sp. IB182357]|uniref:5'-nucleotidase, lipoprotein e(P4) family n=1 Tax=Polycladospora coralii TaxID=2771432 RepID=A0A926N6V7_9BACL|nr:5'-nucleotidase, lipoprotein e(P4) family [Polycladospora coralii]MBD1373609.1 5'-nucleotidase, lipoprotein e(P4) family [Polycladospora coralii]